MNSAEENIEEIDETLENDDEVIPEIDEILYQTLKTQVMKSLIASPRQILMNLMLTI